MLSYHLFSVLNTPCMVLLLILLCLLASSCCHCCVAASLVPGSVGCYKIHQSQNYSKELNRISSIICIWLIPPKEKTTKKSHWPDTLARPAQTGFLLILLTCLHGHVHVAAFVWPARVLTCSVGHYKIHQSQNCSIAVFKWFLTTPEPDLLELVSF